jgi:hypothetical protein
MLHRAAWSSLSVMIWGEPNDPSLVSDFETSRLAGDLSLWPEDVEMR